MISNVYLRHAHHMHTWISMHNNCGHCWEWHKETVLSFRKTWQLHFICRLLPHPYKYISYFHFQSLKCILIAAVGFHKSCYSQTHTIWLGSSSFTAEFKQKIFIINLPPLNWICMIRKQQSWIINSDGVQSRISVFIE